MVVYSYSKLKKFEYCPKSYKFEYVDEVDIDEKQNIFGFLGSRVHETLDFVHEELMDDNNVSLKRSYDYFDYVWDNRWRSGIRRSKKNRNIKYYKRIGKKCLKNYFDNHYPFDSDETIETEMKITYRLNHEDSDYYFVGFVDRLAMEEDGKYVIHDYKTSKNLPSLKKLEQNKQLTIYHLGVKQGFLGVREISLVWHYLRYGKDFRIKKPENKINSDKTKIVNLIQKIENATIENNFPPDRKKQKCYWCDFREICEE